MAARAGTGARLGARRRRRPHRLQSRRPRLGEGADLAVFLAPDEAHRETATQFAARGFVADAAEQASPQDVQLGLAHRAFQAESFGSPAGRDPVAMSVVSLPVTC